MNTNSAPGSRRLTRSTTDRKIGGVAAGLASHLDLDPLVVRIGFAVSILFTGAGLLVYLAMLALVLSDDAPLDRARPVPA